jgi:hypothetical protein
MPITPKFTWDETPAELRLHISIPTAVKSTVTSDNLDLAITRYYAKINLPPALLWLDFANEVDFKSSGIRVVVAQLVVHITLPKVLPTLWGRVSFDGSQEALASRRSSALSEWESYQILLADQNKERKIKRADAALKAEWELEREHRTVVKDLKNAEINATKADLASFETTAVKGQLKLPERKLDEEIAPKLTQHNSELPRPVVSSADMKNPKEVPATQQNPYFPRKKTDSVDRPKTKALPPMRPHAPIVHFTHTERKLKTPAREKKDAELYAQLFAAGRLPY